MNTQRFRANMSLSVLVAAFGFAITACSEKSAQSGGADENAAQAAEKAKLPADASGGTEHAALLKRGAAAFETGMCAKCHREGGTGGDRAPDLTDDKWLHCDGSIAGIRKVLFTGVPKEALKDPSRPYAMNPVTNLVSDSEDLDALAAYVYSLSQ